MTASQFPLPSQLGRTRVLVQGNAVPRSYASPSQMNVQIPAGLAIGQYIVSVQVAGTEVARAPVTVVLRAPGLFIVKNADGLTNSVSSPAHGGDLIQILGTGQGPNPGNNRDCRRRGRAAEPAGAHPRTARGDHRRRAGHSSFQRIGEWICRREEGSIAVSG